MMIEAVFFYGARKNRQLNRGFRLIVDADTGIIRNRFNNAHAVPVLLFIEQVVDAGEHIEMIVKIL